MSDFSDGARAMLDEVLGMVASAERMVQLRVIAKADGLETLAAVLRTLKPVEQTSPARHNITHAPPSYEAAPGPNDPDYGR